MNSDSAQSQNQYPQLNGTVSPNNWASQVAWGPGCFKETINQPFLSNHFLDL